ncbi:MAG: hypothetical protein M0Z72_02635 [Deltaproteobacteria bacterium]|nr:hypothetical protein [Deltaproteobacteria bacterium]
MGQWSQWYSLDETTIDDYASDKPGVYIIGLKGNKYKYPKKQSEIIYIGESHDRTILIRLKEHLNGNGNKKVHNHYKKYKLKFCEMCSSDPYATEQNALNNFAKECGEIPICNER